MLKHKKIEGFESPTRIRRRINEIANLAPLPAVMQSVLEISEDPNSSAQMLGKVIKKDQTLTAKILKIVNSAYFGFYRQISNIDQAIVILGFNEIRNITIATSLIASFPSNFNYVLTREDFWMHSLGSAFIARSICNTKLEINAEDAFVVGLIHDIGKVVLSSYVADGLKEILERVRAGKPFIEAEKEVIGMDHATLGGMIAKRWNFPEEIIDAILYHHNPKEAKTEYAAKVHIADVLCSTLGIGAGNDELSEKIDSEVLKGLGLSGKDLMEMLVELQDRYEKTQSLFTTEQGDGF